MVEFEGRKKVSTNLNIAPLIDMVFLLLLFFMLTSDFITRPGIKLTLPAAVSSKPHQEQKVVVFISKDGDLYLNGRESPPEELRRGLQAILDKTGQKTVTIKADEGVNLKTAVRVMDVARQAGAEGVIISTRTGGDVKR